ncbi:UvrD-helicase domain-containing protein [Arthrobacter sp.]|uniref:UvrD-helicase domain-containing protein n=1 Tax=Arthrobacter sp. TaxID=1667 RepID=UPI00366C668F
MSDTPSLGSHDAVLVAEHEPRRILDPEELAELLGQHRPTPEQSRIISSPLEPMLVIAGAGSGKTATMADRVVWLVANGHVRPEQILGVTFTRKAAGELAQRIRQQLATLAASGLLPAAEDDAPLEPSVSTYHSYANTLVQDHGLRIGVESDTVLLGSAQAWQLASTVVEQYDGAHDHLAASKSTLVDAVVTFAGECAEHLVDHGEARAHLDALVERLAALPYREGKTTPPAQKAVELLNRLRTRATVAELAARYAEAKRLRGVLDYGDLVALAARIARTVPAAGAAERERFKVVLLDEFQDTSHAQMVLFSSLFGGGHAVTAVGDPNQSIYGFRGASAGQLFRFPQEFPAQGPDGAVPAPVAFLTTAWRNAVNVLEAANAVSAALNRVDPNRGAGRIAVPPLAPSPFAGIGRVELSRHDTSAAEATHLAGRLLAEHHDFRARHGRAPTMAVLCRTRGQLGGIAEALVERGIPYEIVGLGGLLGMPEITDLVATLRVLVDPARSDALLRLLAGARWRLGPADLMAFSDWSRFLARRREAAIRERRPLDVDSDGNGPSEGRAEARSELSEAASLVEALDWLPRPGWTSADGRSLSAEALDRLSRLQSEVRRLRAFVDDDLPTLLHEVERALLLDIEVAAKPGVGIHAARRHLDAFLDVAAGYSDSSLRTDLPGFLAWLDAAAAKEGGLEVVQQEATDEAVQLLTIHASKGLEWDVVAVTGLNDGVFPTARDSRWTSGDSALPWFLRGDRHDLPQWDTDQPSLFEALEAEQDFRARVLGHGEAEERRLAYVALTRAKDLLMCSATVWTGTRSKPTAPSLFLNDLLPLADGPTPSASVTEWSDEESAPVENPYREEPVEAVWPYDPLEGPVRARGGVEERRPRGRREGLEAAAAAVRAALDGAEPAPDSAGPGDPVASDGSASDGPRPVTPAGRAWDREASLLLARHEREADGVRPPETPQHVRASLFVELASDPDAVLRQLRRPVPRRPGVAARKGTAFHAWVEEHYGTTGMLDLGEFPGAADAYVEDRYGLEEMKAAFLASEWADRQPAFVEVPLETRVGPVSVRGRIDAVFREEEAGGEPSWILVDWKTGRVPAGRELAVKSLQLAVYRLGWARLHGIDPSAVKAAFYYVGEGRTIRPHDLAGEAELVRLITAALAPAGD